MTASPDVDAWLDNYVAREAEARLWPNDLLARHAEVDRQLAGHPGPDRQKELAAEVIAIEAEADKRAMVFRFRAIGQLRWANLIAAHPPTEEQLTADRELDHNPETFPVAAIAASAVEPELTVEQVERMRSKLQVAEWSEVWAATLRANLGAIEAFPKSVLGAAIARLVSAASATTASPAASPDPSSSRGTPRTSEPPSNGSTSKTRSARGATGPGRKASPRKR